MHTKKELTEGCLSVLRTQLAPGELEIAQGRCDYLPTLAGVPRGGGYTFVLVTEDRILWTDYLGPGRVYAERFSAIRSFSEGSYKHRWILLLRHGPSVRMESSPKWYRPTSRSAPPTEAPVDRTETVLEFSRRQTAAAEAILARLHGLHVPEKEPLRLAERPRSEPVLLTTVPRSRLRRWMRLRRLRRFRRRWS
jgi:hypothetical protein